MTTSPSDVHVTTAPGNCGWCAADTVGSTAVLQTGRIRFETAPLPPDGRRRRIEKAPGYFRACSLCEPLVRARAFDTLATRNVIHAMTRDDLSAEQIPPAELARLFEVVDGALLVEV